MKLDPELNDWLIRQVDANAIEQVTLVQSLWSGYGQILRVGLNGCRRADVDGDSVIVKQISPPEFAGAGSDNHPRGWNTSISHQRKLRSYEVETAFYDHFSDRCHSACRVPRCLASADLPIGRVLVLEDLNASGFLIRHHRLDDVGVTLGLRWLANFHALFLHPPKDAAAFDSLWPVGTYWHLATRPDEFDAMPDGRLKVSASALDQTLNDCEYQTLVHGDAKVANMCFASDRVHPPGVVDFQYVGRGCGMKDVAYFLSSCISESECEQNESRYLATYFDAFHASLREHRTSDFSEPQLAAIETQWRRLYPIAWADFVRFLEGWCPGHAKLTGYSKRMVEVACRD